MKIEKTIYILTHFMDWPWDDERRTNEQKGADGQR